LGRRRNLSQMYEYISKKILNILYGSVRGSRTGCGVFKLKREKKHRRHCTVDIKGKQA
jgi:hypothetical protein